MRVLLFLFVSALTFRVQFLQPGTKPKVIHADSQADVETFRQDTIDYRQDTIVDANNVD